jgi:inosine/xanthosine triphosphate pyrophosphatase family protein/dephospho-CoA kinase
MTVPRPSPRPLFLEPARRLSIKFYTSNLPKYLQAKAVFEAFGLSLSYFQSREDPYREDYGQGTEALLTNAIDEILANVGRTSLFFVEDTSLRIDAFSAERGADVPGLAVKEWFAATTFAEMNRSLPNDLRRRRAIVKSDIALHVPGVTDPVFFHGETSGIIAPTPPRFPENPMCPWLTPSTFNGWFIPDGAGRRLGEMSFEEAWTYDFRVRSLVGLVNRLEEYAALLNAPRDVYSVDPHRGSPAQPGLFASNARQLIVVGATCAGKTTFGNLAYQRVPSLKVVDASSIVRSFKRKRDVGVDPFQFARGLLQAHGANVVARRIIAMYRLDHNSEYLIGGFRTIQEVEAIREVCPHVRVVLIKASVRTRYARLLTRGREGAAVTYKEFLATDRQQSGFGLLRVAEEFADIKVVNEGTYDYFTAQIQAVVDNPRAPRWSGVSSNVRPRHKLHVHRLYRCLNILERGGRAMTCEEISHESSTRATKGAERTRRYIGKAITANNVNKILKQVPELAKRIEAVRARVRYKLTDAGAAYLRLVRLYSGTREHARPTRHR